MVLIKQFRTKYAQTFFCIKREDKTEHTLLCGKAGSVWHGAAVFLLTDGDKRLVPSVHGRYQVTPVVSTPGRDKSPVTEITFVQTPSRSPQTPPWHLHPHETGPQAQAPPPAHTQASHSPCSSLLTTHTPAHLATTAQMVLLKSSSPSGWFQTHSHFPKPTFQSLCHSHKWQIY